MFPGISSVAMSHGVEIVDLGPRNGRIARFLVNSINSPFLYSTFPKSLSGGRRGGRVVHRRQR